MYQALSHFGTPEWNSEELAFAKQIQATLTSNDRQNSLNNIAATVAKTARFLHYVIVKRYWRMKSLHMPPPITCLRHRLMSATSVGNCLLPSVSAPCFAVGTPLHTWQLVSQGRTSIAHKGMLLAAKTMAATTVNLFLDSGLLQECPTRASASNGHATVSLPYPEKRDTVTLK